MKAKTLLILLFISTGVAWAQKPVKDNHAPVRILFLLDESVSMAKKWHKRTPEYKIANELIVRIMDSLYQINNQVQFSLQVVGGDHEPNSCNASKIEVAFNKDDRNEIAQRLTSLRPQGTSPLAFALQEAAEKNMPDDIHNVYGLVLITDGVDGSDANICDVVKRYIQRKVFFKPYIIALADDAQLKTRYDCLGRCIQVLDKDDVTKVLHTISEAFRPMLGISKTEYRQLQTIIYGIPQR